MVMPPDPVDSDPPDPPVVCEPPPAPGVPVMEPVMSVPVEVPVDVVLLGSLLVLSPPLPSLQAIPTNAQHARIEVVKVLICFSVPSKSSQDVPAAHELAVLIVPCGDSSQK
jgi:hypothetical protein